MAVGILFILASVLMFSYANNAIEMYCSVFTASAGALLVVLDVLLVAGVLK